MIELLRKEVSSTGKAKVYSCNSNIEIGLDSTGVLLTLFNISINVRFVTLLFELIKQCCRGRTTHGW